MQLKERWGFVAVCGWSIFCVCVCLCMDLYVIPLCVCVCVCRYKVLQD